MNRQYRTPTNPATRAALDARAHHEGLRQEYRFFVEDCKRDLAPAEWADGIPTFTKWMEENGHA